MGRDRGLGFLESLRPTIAIDGGFQDGFSSYDPTRAPRGFEYWRHAHLPRHSLWETSSLSAALVRSGAGSATAVPDRVSVCRLARRGTVKRRPRYTIPLSMMYFQ